MSDNINQIEQLQDELDQKEELILALTERLRESADQLDRIQRTGGAIRGGADSGGSSELQSKIASQIGEALREWDALDPGGRFDRIENGIEQILNSLDNFQYQAGPATSGGSTEDKEEDAGLSYWEAAKARLMGDESEEAAAAPSATPPPRDSQQQSSAPPGTASVGATQSEPEPETVSIPEPPAPEPVEAETDPTILLEAVTTRDRYIEYLTARLRAEQDRVSGKVDWARLSESPEELRTEVESLKARLQEQLKMAEVSNALERATLARERSKLFQVKQQLERQVQRLAANDSASEAKTEEPSKADKRWARLFSK